MYNKKLIKSTKLGWNILAQKVRTETRQNVGKQEQMERKKRNTNNLKNDEEERKDETSIDFMNMGSTMVEGDEKKFVPIFNKKKNSGKSNAAQWVDRNIPELGFKKLSETRERLVHYPVEKLLYLGKGTRQDIQTTVAFLRTRVKEPETNEYKN